MNRYDWWRGAALYQVYLQSFYDSNADGVGDLPGLVSHLDYIAELGVDGIWITPFYPSPMADGGYDVADYCGVDPRYGTLDDLDALVAQSHALGLKLVIDQVWSHTAVDHSWFRESRTSRSNNKADWYVWADAADDGGPPNNWLSVFGGSAWSWDASRRQYYLHHFLPGQPKLNLRNEDVLNAHFANEEFWLARGVDGFRLDAVDFMLHDPALRNNPPDMRQEGEKPWNPFRLQRHLYDMCHPENQQLAGSIRRFTDRFPGILVMGEISSQADALGRIAKMTGANRLHMAYTLGVMKKNFDRSLLQRTIEDAVAVNRAGWLCWSFSNHDVERVVSRWNPKSAHATAFARLTLSLLLSLPGSICIYQGEELGLPEAQLPVEAMRDPFGLTFYPAYHGRDGARTPLPWRAGERHSGFSRAKKTWLPVDMSHDALSVDRQEADQQSPLRCCRQMLKWRRQHPALSQGDFQFLSFPGPVLGWRQALGHDRTVAIFNLSPDPVTIEGYDLLSFTTAAELDFVVAPANGRLHLPPFGVSIGHEDGNRQ